MKHCGNLALDGNAETEPLIERREPFLFNIRLEILLVSRYHAKQQERARKPKQNHRMAISKKLTAFVYLSQKIYWFMFDNNADLKRIDDDMKKIIEKIFDRAPRQCHFSMNELETLASIIVSDFSHTMKIRRDLLSRNGIASTTTN
jgi:hypothetical protein